MSDEGPMSGDGPARDRGPVPAGGPAHAGDPVGVGGRPDDVAAPSFRITGGTFGRNGAGRTGVPAEGGPAVAGPSGAPGYAMPPAPGAGPVPAATGVDPSGDTDGRLAAAHGPAARGQRLLVIGYVVLLVACSLLSLTWLVVGALTGVAEVSPSVARVLAAAAAEGNRWAKGVLDSLPRSEPGAQMVLDYVFSATSLGLALVMAVRGGRSWSSRLLVLALVGSAGAFNLQAHAAAVAVETATGLAIGGLHQILLHGVACAAYVLGLLVFPPGQPGLARPDSTRVALTVVTVGTLLFVGLGTALLPHTTSCVLFFGFAVPVAGLLALPRRVRTGATDEQRTQARLLFSVLLAAVAIAVVLAALSVLVWSLGWPGLTLVDPTAHGGAGLPLALLFWFARLACVAIAGAVLIASRRGGLLTAERLFSRGLVAALAAAVVGGGYVAVHTGVTIALGDHPDVGLLSAIVATAVAAVAFLPTYLGTERVVDRLLYGTRPTPYSVLAGIAALSRATAADAPDLARVAEAVGRGLGATTCQLTVIRPGLRDRTYVWSEPGAHHSDILTKVAVRHGEERIGTIAVDRAAVAGLQAQRQHLLTDIADSLGAVLQASRYGIELERQLRAALAHAGEIAVSRRAAVAEMDGERRRIERDLHDGAQHHLVSLRLTLGLVEHLVSTGKFDQARERLDQIVDQIHNAETILSETATGVSSPLLSEHGLAGALTRELGGGSPPITVDATGIPPDRRFPADVEAAVWYCCLEAVNNARKHAAGAPVTIRLGAEGGLLRFSVRDEGPGWDPSAGGAGPGRGMRNLMARISSVGGRIDVRSRPGAGTTVEGGVPVPAPDRTGPAVPVHGQVAPAVSVPAAPPPAVPAPRAPSEGPAAAAPPAGGPPPPAAPRPAQRLRPPLAGSSQPAEAGATAGSGLLEQVRAVVRTAGEHYRGTPQAPSVAQLAARLDEPLRLAVVGPPGVGTSTLVEALLERPCGAAAPGAEVRAPAELLPRLSVVDVAGPAAAELLDPGDPEVDALLLLMRYGRPEDVAGFGGLHIGAVPHRRASAIGVLARADELGAGPALDPAAAARAAADWAARPDVRALCHTVLPVSGLVARAAATLSDADVAALAEAARTGTAPPADLAARLGPAGLRLAVDLVRAGCGPGTAPLAAELLEHSGLPALREHVEARFLRRADALKARSALLRLEALVRREPPPGGAGRLRYELERVRAGAHELTEIDLLDLLATGVAMPADELATAERMLGTAGTEPRARLGLAPDAAADDIARAAADGLVHWQRLASHPASTQEVRAVATVLVRTCEDLVAGAARRQS